jgi:hypothetical protein
MDLSKEWPQRLTFVYDADGTLRGEVTYVVGHLLGRLECAMCDISHSPLGRRKTWIAWVNRLASHGIEIETLHRNDLATTHYAELGACIAGRFPCATATGADGSHQFVLGKDELESCSGKLEPLIDLLEKAGLIPSNLV